MMRRRLRRALALLAGMIASGAAYAMLATGSSTLLARLGPPEKTAWVILAVIAPFALLLGGAVTGRIARMTFTASPGTWRQALALTPGIYISVLLVALGLISERRGVPRMVWISPVIVILSFLGTKKALHGS